MEGGQEVLWGSQFTHLKLAAESMREVGDLSDLTSKQVKQSRKKFLEASDLLAPYKRILDIYTSQWFGNKPVKTRKGKKGVFQNPSVDFLKSDEAHTYIQQRQSRQLSAYGKKLVATATNAQAQKRFFHWELEFPEIFFEKGMRKPRAGFDVVVGNPPYVRQEGLGEDKEFLMCSHSPVYSGTADLYVYFYHLGLAVCRDDGFFGMITSNKFLRAAYGKSLRQYLAKHQIFQIIDFRDLPVFEDATSYPLILLLKKSPAQESSVVGVYPVESINQIEHLSDAFAQGATPLQSGRLRGDQWLLQGSEVSDLCEKIRNSGRPLTEIVKGQFFRGIVKGFNKAFLIDEQTRSELLEEDARSDEIIKPFLRGRDIKRYALNFTGHYLIFTRRGINIDKYPAVKRHLAQWREKLTPKKDESDAGPGRKPGPYKWYEIQDAIAYHEEFLSPKIVWPDISPSCNFAYDESGHFVGDTGNIMVTNDLTLLALLNSKIIEFYYRHSAAQVRGGYLRFKSVYMQALPIVELPHSDRKSLEDAIRNLFSASDDAVAVEQLEHKINELVCHAYGMTHREISTVEEFISLGNKNCHCS